MAFTGYGAIVPLDYGHPGHEPEHSLLLMSDDWASLVQLIAAPFQFLEKAREDFTFDTTTQDFKWDVPGPLTIILEPLTTPTRASVDGLRAISAALNLRRLERPAAAQPELMGPITKLSPLISNWQDFTPRKWRKDVLDAFTLNGKRKGFYLVEFALVTRVMVIRYVTPDVFQFPNHFYQQQITAVTFSDFLKGLAGAFVPRNAFMHFDLLPRDRDFSHGQVALMKAQFAVDYIMGPCRTIGRLCNPTLKTLDKQVALHDYFYGSAMFANTYSTLTNKMTITPTTNGEQAPDFPAMEDRQPIIDRDYHDPTLILESVDPWADGWIWESVPLFRNSNERRRIDRRPREAFSGRGKSDPLAKTDEDPANPVPCVLIYITVNGQGQYVIDPSSALVKNYVAPTQGGGSG